MRVGDLVRHPKGVINVSAWRYSCGLVIRTEPAGRLGDQVTCLVLWRGNLSPWAYNAASLEVISEGR
jgi:hypothetical protein